MAAFPTTVSLASSFIHCSSTPRVVRSFSSSSSSLFFFLSFTDQTPPPLFSRFFSFPFFPTSPAPSRPAPPTYLQSSNQTGVTPSFSYLSYLIPALPTRTAFHHVPSPPHAPAPSTFLAVVRSTTTTTRRDDALATRVHGTRIMEVFSAKVKLSGSKA